MSRVGRKGGSARRTRIGIGGVMMVVIVVVTTTATTNNDFAFFIHWGAGVLPVLRVIGVSGVFRLVKLMQSIRVKWATHEHTGPASSFRVLDIGRRKQNGRQLAFLVSKRMRKSSGLLARIMTSLSSKVFEMFGLRAGQGRLSMQRHRRNAIELEGKSYHIMKFIYSLFIHLSINLAIYVSACLTIYYICLIVYNKPQSKASNLTFGKVDTDE